MDCLYVNIRIENETKNCAVYVVEGKYKWMQIFDEIKARGVEDISFISMDGVSGL